MKKARIILSAVAVLALVGGAFAFKAAKFNGFRAFTLTTQYATNGTIYTAPNNAAFFLPLTPARFITNVGTVPTTVYSTTLLVTTDPLVLSEVGGPGTIGISDYAGTQIANTRTTAVN